MNEQKAKTTWVDRFIGLLLLVGLFYITNYIWGGNSVNDSPEYTAIAMARVFVEERLNVPSSASYPHRREAIVTSGGTDIYIVKENFEAKNALGVKLRSKYRAKVMNLKNGKWKLLALKIY